MEKAVEIIIFQLGFYFFPNSNKMGRKSRPSFFKIMIGDFSEKLRIPQAFIKHFDDKLPEKVLLKSMTRRSWVMNMKKSEIDLFFSNGWEAFVQDHHLEFGDMLLFRYKGNAMFNVKIYGRTGCEKEITPSTDNIIDVPIRETEAQSGMRNGDASREEVNPSRKKSCDSPREKIIAQTKKSGNVSREEVDLSRKRSADVPCEKKIVPIKSSRTVPCKEIALPKKKRDNNSGDKMLVLPKNVPHEGKTTLSKTNDNGHYGKKNGLFITENNDPPRMKMKQEVSTTEVAKVPSFLGKSTEHDAKRKATCSSYKKQKRRRIVQVEKKANLGSVTFDSSCFTAACTSNRKYYMTVPKMVAKENRLMKKESVELRDPNGKLWPVKLVRRKDGRVNLEAGWNEFQIENNLEDGDMCRFKFIKGFGNVVSVEIFRAGATESTKQLERPIQMLTHTPMEQPVQVQASTPVTVKLEELEE